MRRWFALGGSLTCSLALMIASEASAQPAQPYVVEQPPLAPPPPGQAQIITTGNGTITSGNGAQPTIIVVQGGNGSYAKRRRTVIPAEDGQPPPQGFHTEERMMKGLAIGGWSMFGAAYLVTAIGGLVVGIYNSCSLGTNCNNSIGDNGYVGFIPIAGPWFYVGASDVGGARVLFGVMGVLQAGGLAMAIGGMAAHTDVWVSNDAKNHYGPRFGVGPGNMSFTTNF